MKVTIQSGEHPHDIRVLVDGEPVQRLRAFRLIGDGPDQRMVLELHVVPDEIEVEADADVVTQP